MSESPRPLVSVVIVNFRGADDTIECVSRLGEVDWPHDLLEIVVVENGSGDDSLKRLKAAFGGDSRVKIVVSHDNLGFTGGSNLGARSAKGDFVAFLNNDAKPDTAWITEAIERFSGNDRVAAVASKVLDWDGKTIDFVGGSLTWYGMGFKDHVTEVDTGEYDVERNILFGTGSALFVRASVFEAVGGFDESLFMFYDDVDLGWRLNMLGYAVRFVPTSVVYHKHHGSMRSFGTHREMYLLERNALALLYKNLGEEHFQDFLPAALALVARRAVSKSGLDSEMFDIRRFTGSDDEFDPDIAVNKEAVAGLFALDQFVERLPALTVARRAVQSTRVRSDAELFRSFGDLFRPLFGDPHFLAGLGKLVTGFNIAAATRRVRVLVITGDAIGDRMAGPAMRAWKICETLGQQNDVRLVTWNDVSRGSDSFDVARVRIGNEREMSSHEAWADVIIFQGHAMHHFKTIRDSSKPMVVDLYDPIHLEQLEQGREFGTPQWRAQVKGATGVLNQQLIRGDFFLCASERQRLFWLGQLAAVGRINPDNYMDDENLAKLITVVPFGMSSDDPRHERAAIRGVVPGIGQEDKIVMWGGGMYNWFDTLTLVEAIGILAERHDDVRLFFLGVKHPNPDVPEMAIVGKTRELASRLGLLDTKVFFNERWVALDDRQSYLTESDVGVSTHFDHIETTLSFRTRILDYMWARLPIVTTRGDSFGDLVEIEGMGRSVPERNPQILAEALESMLYDSAARDAAIEAVDRVRGDFTWEQVLRPLVEFCRDPRTAPDRLVEAGARKRKNRRSGHDEIVETPGSDFEAEDWARYHRVGTMAPGPLRDLSLARFYLSQGGFSLVREKMRSRLGR